MRISLLNVPAALREPAAVEHKLTQPLPADSALSVLWVGHATALVQIDDKFILTDPVFTDFVGGVSKRLVEPGIAAEHLPEIAVALVSHRHFDHLSPDSLRLIGSRLGTVLAPVGAAGDVPAGAYRTVELPTGSAWEHDGLRVTAVPVLHDGGRLLFDRDSHPHAFTGYVVEYHGKRVYFPGDTSYRANLFHAVVERFGPMDLALMPICPIAPESTMHPHHLTPDEALRAVDELQAVVMVPIHFDTFVNSFDVPGDCLRALNQAMDANLDRKARVEVLRVGEQRVLLEQKRQGRGGAV